MFLPAENARSWGDMADTASRGRCWFKPDIISDDNEIFFKGSCEFECPFESTGTYAIVGCHLDVLRANVDDLALKKIFRLNFLWFFPRCFVLVSEFVF
jgi:hypothetical protein